MLLIPCPYCGSRPEVEFHCSGEAHIVKPHDPDQVDDSAWGDYLFVRTNPRGLHRERWRHVHGCGRFFNVARNTLSDKILASYKIGSRPPETDFGSELVS